jgi:hypothetical protein
LATEPLDLKGLAVVVVMGVEFVAFAALPAAFAVLGLRHVPTFDRVVQDPLGFCSLWVALAIGAIGSLDSLGVLQLGAFNLLPALLRVGFPPMLLSFSLAW